MYASPANEHWYVAAENGPRVALLVGPFANHSDAAKWVIPTHSYVREAYSGDILATFAVFGVARILTDAPPPGKLNTAVGLSGAATRPA